MIDEAQKSLLSCFDNLTKSLTTVSKSNEQIDPNLLKKSFDQFDQALKRLPDYENDTLENKLEALNHSFDFDSTITKLYQKLEILKLQRKELAEKYNFIINDFLINK
jgi:hypothetical protein